MSTVTTFDFDPAKSGMILKSGFATYTPYTGANNCQTGQDASAGTSWRAYFNFDTSSLPDDCETFLREFIVALSDLAPPGEPESYIIKFSVGTFIGAVLTGNAATWNAGTLIITRTERPTDHEVIDLDEEFLCDDSKINKTGDTDLKIWDDSIKGISTWNFWNTLFNNKRNCQLRITWGWARSSVTIVISTEATASVLRRGVASVAIELSQTSVGLVDKVASATVAIELPLIYAPATVTRPGTATVTIELTTEVIPSVSRIGSASVLISISTVAKGMVTGGYSPYAYATMTLDALAVAATGTVRPSWGVDRLQEAVEAALKAFTAEGRSLSEVSEDSVFGMVVDEKTFHAGLPMLLATASVQNALDTDANGKIRKKARVEIIAITPALKENPQEAYKDARSLLDRLNTILWEEYRTWTDIVLEALPLPPDPPRGVQRGEEVAALASVARSDYYLRRY